MSDPDPRSADPDKYADEHGAFALQEAADRFEAAAEGVCYQ